MSKAARIGWRDLWAEALAGLLQRPARSMLTTLGTVLAVGAFVVVLGLTATTSGQLDKRFSELNATEVYVEDVGADEESGDGLSFPPDAAARIERLNGVRHAGVWWPVAVRELTISGIPGVARAGLDLTLLAADTSALAAMRPEIHVGRLYDEFHSRRSERVAVLGSVAAARLSVTRLEGHPAVFVNGLPFTVLGVIDDVERLPDTLSSVIIPTTTALATYGPPRERPAGMLIETQLGAAQLIASQAALALRPDAPQRFKVMAMPEPRALRGGVAEDMNVLFLLLGVVSLLVGSVGIANTTVVSVIERTGEIGLRRALGASPAHVAVQFLSESSILGLFGGLLGTSVGVLVVVCVAVANRWTAVIDPWAVLPMPLVGWLIGLLAGAYPAWRAARIEPADALRR